MDDLIRNVSEQMAEGYRTAEIPMYGASLRLPERQAVLELLSDFQKILFPAYFADKHLVTLPPEQYCALLLHHVAEKLERQIMLSLPEEEADRAGEITRRLISRLPKIQSLLLKDLAAGFEGDPAATSKEEVVLCYPGFYAVFVYRIAHELYIERVPTIARIMSEYAHGQTGIDINPGATIGEYFFIDHGTGIVVGETTIIGNRVKMYQGSTLGALSTRAGHNAYTGRRHPKVGNNVTIYANATILGGRTEIGDNTVIGGSAFITESIADDMKVLIEAPTLRLREQK